jgi:hypothetical protein
MEVKMRDIFYNIKYHKKITEKYKNFPNKLLDDYGVNMDDRVLYHNITRCKKKTVNKSNKFPVYKNRNKRGRMIERIRRMAIDRINDLEGGFEKLKTRRGNTQKIERLYIEILENILDELGFVYEKANSQQPYDFRIILPIPTLLEIKKCDNNNISLNDTLPMYYADYLIISVKKQDIIHVNGVELNPYGDENYNNQYNEYRETFNRIFKDIELDNPIAFRALLDILIEKAKSLTGYLQAYFRPNWGIKSLNDLFRLKTEEREG